MIAIKEQISSFWKEIPPLVKTFLIRALVLFVVWQIVYITVLMPNRLIDRPFSNFIGKCTASLINFYYGKNDVTSIEYKRVFNRGDNIIDTQERVQIINSNKKVIGISDSCNGLSVVVLYLGFIIALNSKNNNKIFIYFIIGILSILVANIFRCVILGILVIEKSHFVNIAHHYIFNTLIYTIIFLLWYRFLDRKNGF